MSSIKKNFFYNIVLSVTQVLFPLITFSYVARVIEPVGIGTVSFVESICRYAMLIAALGIPVYGVREVAKLKGNKVELSKLCSELLIIHFVATFIVSVIYIITVLITEKLNSNLEFYLLGLLMVFSNIFIMEWYFQGVGDFKFITVRTLIVRIITTISVFFLVTNKNESFNFFLLTVLTNIINGIINFSYAQKSLNLSYSIIFSRLRKHFKPLFFIFSTTISISIYVLLDTIMLGFLANDKAVGYYSMALKISKVPMIFVGALGLVLIPQLSLSFHQNDIERFKLLISKSINFVITFSFPVIFFILGISDELIRAFAGEQFLGAAITLKILSILVLLIGLSNIFGLQILTPMSKDKYLTFSVILGTGVSLCLNYILIPFYQEIGAAITNIITEVVVTGATLYFASKFISIEFDYFFILKSLFYSIPIYFFPILWSYLISNYLLILIITSVISGIYFIIVQLYIIKNQIIVELKNKLIQKIWPNTII
jgi:O-antigen/teichoic acid export membrane protein